MEQLNKLNAFPAVWRQRLKDAIDPPLTSVQDFMERPDNVICKQVGCSFGDLVELKTILIMQQGIWLADSSNAEIVRPWRGLPTLQLRNQQQRKSGLTTGLTQIDDLFFGGLPRGEVTCFLGESSSGRTQICTQAAATCALQGFRVFYIDTHNQVSLQRIHGFLSLALVEEQISQSTALTQEEQAERMTSALQRLHLHRCFDLFEAIQFLTQLVELQDIEYDIRRRFDLIVVDSVYDLAATYLQDSGERFQHSTSSIGGSYSSGRVNSIANVHPLLSQLGVLLRRVATAVPRPPHNPNGGCDAATQPQHYLEMRSDVTAAQPASVLVTQLASPSSSRSLSQCFQEIFDSVLHCAQIASDESATTISVTAVQRPPYYKARAEIARVVFPW